VSDVDGDYDWDDVCEHDCDDDCWDRCRHEHCWLCGECGCAGYCDDHETYNLRFAETGGEDPW
jgi:hypothetical protein